jgi:hypothetical protein
MTTIAIINTVMPACVAGLTLAYLGTDTEEYKMAKNGQYESCLEKAHSLQAQHQTAETKRALWRLFSGACEGGYSELVDLLIANGAESWRSGATSACRGNHFDIAKRLVDRSYDAISSWNACLMGASLGGHQELVDTILAHRGTSELEDPIAFMKANPRLLPFAAYLEARQTS